MAGLEGEGLMFKILRSLKHAIPEYTNVHSICKLKNVNGMEFLNAPAQV